MRALPVVASILLAPAVYGDELDDAHRKLLGHTDLQFQFTALQVQPEPPAEGWLFDLLRGLSPFFNLIFWGGLAAILLTLAFFIGRETIRARYGRFEKERIRADEQQTIYTPAPEKARALLEDADSLAARGLYDQAVHILLHRSIDDIEQRLPRAVRPAQTSREIARLALLPVAVREAFDPLVRAVERSWFGGIALDDAGYQVCRKSYADFAFAGAWR